jgi:hypothetical protein
VVGHAGNVGAECVEKSRHLGFIRCRHFAVDALRDGSKRRGISSDIHLRSQRKCPAVIDGGADEQHDGHHAKREYEGDIRAPIGGEFSQGQTDMERAMGMMHFDTCA